MAEKAETTEEHGTTGDSISTEAVFFVCLFVCFEKSVTTYILVHLYQYMQIFRSLKTPAHVLTRG